jgi:hypothetical protein
MFIKQIINHYVSHFVNQNDKVQIDYLVMLVNKIDLSKLKRWSFLHLSFLDFFKLENQIKKTMNCSSVCSIHDGCICDQPNDIKKCRVIRMDYV